MQKEMPILFEGKISQLVELARNQDTHALESIIHYFKEDIDTLSRKAKFVGISQEEAKQIIIINFIERLVHSWK